MPVRDIGGNCVLIPNHRNARPKIGGSCDRTASHRHIRDLASPFVCTRAVEGTTVLQGPGIAVAGPPGTATQARHAEEPPADEAAAVVGSSVAIPGVSAAAGRFAASRKHSASFFAVAGPSTRHDIASCSAACFSSS